ncbi:MAG: ribose 5-phosphate isomerase B [Phycisphaera sp.]|nr:ribose 5-phosphate isomerase B [Phycisphaera sp.]
MKIAIGADHRGKDVFETLCRVLSTQGHDLAKFDLSQHRTMCDYPDVAYPVALMVSRSEADFGVLICGSGIGMSIAANKVHGVRAAMVHDEVSADMSRRHNNANVLCLAADLLGMRIIERIVTNWLNTPFDGGRHERRVRKIAAIEAGRDPATVSDNVNDADSTAA